MIFCGICDVNIQSDKFKKSMNEHIHGSMHKELSFVQLQMSTYAFGMFRDDAKNRKIRNLPKKQITNKEEKC
jgi:hypothetical protein